MNIEDSCISCIDTDWSYQLARRMEKEKTNPVLGYRTAGSAAETATGDMLYREMKAIGLTDVTRDTFSLDGWEFEKAVLKFTDDDGQEHTFQMGGYQTNFVMVEEGDRQVAQSDSFIWEKELPQIMKA